MTDDEKKRIDTDPFGYLDDCLREAGIVPTFDRRRSISLPCWMCDTIRAPRTLVEIGRYTRRCGGNLMPGHAIERPMCADCVKLTTPVADGEPT